MLTPIHDEDRLPLPGDWTAEPRYSLVDVILGALVGALVGGIAMYAGMLTLMGGLGRLAS